MGTPSSNRRKRERRGCSLYMRFLDGRTGEPIGDLGDLSRDGFLLETLKPIPLNVDYSFRIELSAEISTKPSIVLTARSRWSRPDPLDGRLYDVGFEITNIDAVNAQAFDAIYERFGSRKASGGSGTGYVRSS